MPNSSGFLDLKNPTNDVKAVSDALTSAGFSVRHVNVEYDAMALTRQTIKREVYAFAEKLKSAPSGVVGLIYFAGHGVEYNDEIYLAPYDLYVQFDRDLREELVPVSFFYDAFAYAGNQFNFIVLDVCRDSPWKSLRPFGGKPPEVGTHVSRQSTNVVLATSVWDSATALDGVGHLSPYASSFIEALKKADVGYLATFGDIGLSFVALAQQYPSISPPPTPVGPSGREFIFRPTETSFNQEKKIFEVGMQKGSPSLLKTLLYQFPAGYFNTWIAQWIKNATLQNSSVDLDGIEWAPKGVVKVQSNVELRMAPSAKSEIVEAQQPGKRFVLLDHASKDNWRAVWTGKTIAYVPESKVATQPPQKTQTIPIEFTKGPAPGVEILTSKSADELKLALAGDKATIAGSVEVVAYKLPPSGGLQRLEPIGSAGECDRGSGRFRL